MDAIASRDGAVTLYTMSQLILSQSSPLSIPGATFARNGLAIAEGVSPDELRTIGAALESVGGSHLWWWGDYLVTLETRYGTLYNETESISGYTYNTLAQAKAVAAAYHISCRQLTLSYSHHREAYYETGTDILKALEWLAKADDNNWSVKEMRAAIRLSLAKEQESDPGADKGTKEELALNEYRLLLPSLPTPGRITDNRRNEWIDTLKPIAELYNALIEAGEPKRVAGRVIAEQEEMF